MSPIETDTGAGLDLLLFFCLLGGLGGLFVVFHVIALRLHDTRRLLVYLLSTYLLAAAAGTGLAYWLLADLFSSPNCYWIANLGAVVAGFFAAGLYAFLGPATADRSLTAHLFVFLLSQPGSRMAEADLREAYSAENFFAKRFEECTAAGLLRVADGQVELTGKGRAFARLYRFQLEMLGLNRRDQHLPSFTERERS